MSHEGYRILQEYTCTLCSQVFTAASSYSQTSVLKTRYRWTQSGAGWTCARHTREERRLAAGGQQMSHQGHRTLQEYTCVLCSHQDVVESSYSVSATMKEKYGWKQTPAGWVCAQHTSAERRTALKERRAVDTLRIFDALRAAGGTLSQHKLPQPPLVDGLLRVLRDKGLIREHFAPAPEGWSYELTPEGERAWRVLESGE